MSAAYKTKTGGPRLGGCCEVEIGDGSWLPAKVLARGKSNDGRRIVMFEFTDAEGGRSNWLYWDDIFTRAVRS